MVEFKLHFRRFIEKFSLFFNRSEALLTDHFSAVKPALKLRVDQQDRSFPTSWRSINMTRLVVGCLDPHNRILFITRSIYEREGGGV